MHWRVAASHGERLRLVPWCVPCRAMFGELFFFCRSGVESASPVEDLMRTLILLPLLAVLSLVPAKARAACTGPGEVPEWVKRFEHGATSCDKLSQRLSTVRVPRADNAVAVDWEEWRQAPLVVVSHGTISFNGEVVVDIGPDHRVPESAFNGQTIKKLRAAANVYREAHLRDGSVTGAIVVAKADTPHPTFRERLHRAVVVVDAETPYQTVGQVLYTLALARYGTFGFAVGDQNPGRKGELKAGSASGSTPMSAQRPYQLSVAVTAQGFTILGADDVLFPGGKPAAVFDEPTHPCAGGSCEGVDSYDWDGLKATLVRVKKVRPRTMSMIVVSSEGSPKLCSSACRMWRACMTTPVPSARCSPGQCSLVGPLVAAGPQVALHPCLARPARRAGLSWESSMSSPCSAAALLVGRRQ